MDRPVDLLILGASARAAAHSALRAGLAPAAVDLFADRDLQAVAPAVRVGQDAYPDGLFHESSAFPDVPWIYTGALENRPELVDRLAARRTLWGNLGATLRGVRDPEALTRVLQAEGLPALRVSLDRAATPRDGSWLIKPRASGGGLGIALLGPDRTDDAPGSYHQERALGTAASAVFVGHDRGVVLAGISLQLVGRPGAPFAYRGSLAPWPVAIETKRTVEAIGSALARAFGLVGLFGVDFVIDDEGRPWTVEVNPRYTASVEVLELASGRAWLLAHRAACEGREVEAPAATIERYVAKEVLFATGPTTYPGPESDPPPVAWASGRFAIPEAADIPAPGTVFSIGEPIVTVFGRGEDVDSCLRDLAESRRRWEARIRPG